MALLEWAYPKDTTARSYINILAMSVSKKVILS